MGLQGPQNSVEVNGVSIRLALAPHDALSTEPECLLTPVAELWLEAERGAEAGIQEARLSSQLQTLPQTANHAAEGGNPGAGAGVEEGMLPEL